MALIDTHKAVKQFTTAGIPEKQAEAITEVISSVDSKLATKSDINLLKSDIYRLEDKLDTNMKWIMTVGIAIFLMLIKLTFFNS
jgi:polyhydroxyalkanoate synthesis regulator phasin